MNIRKTMKNKWVSLSIGVIVLAGGGRFFFSLKNPAEKEIARINGLQISSDMYLDAYKKEDEFRKKFKQMGINLDYPIDTHRIMEGCFQRTISGLMAKNLGFRVGPSQLWFYLSSKMSKDILNELRDEKDGSLNLASYAKFSRLYQGKPIAEFEKEQIENIERDALTDSLKTLWHVPSYLKEFKSRSKNLKKTISQITVKDSQIESEALELIQESDVYSLYNTSDLKYLGASLTAVDVKTIDFSNLKPEDVEVQDDEVRRFYQANMKRKYHVPAKYKLNLTKVTKGFEKSSNLQDLLKKIETEGSKLTGKQIVDQISLLTKNNEIKSQVELGVEVELGLGRMPDALESNIRQAFSDSEKSISNKNIVYTDNQNETLYIVTLISKNNSKTVSMQDAYKEIEAEISQRKLASFIEKAGDVIVRAAKSDGDNTPELINKVISGVFDLKSNDRLDEIRLSQESLSLENLELGQTGSAATTLEKTISSHLKSKKIRPGIVAKAIDGSKLIIFKVTDYKKPEKISFDNAKDDVQKDLVEIKKKEVIDSLKNKIKKDLVSIIADVSAVEKYALDAGYKFSSNSKEQIDGLEHVGQAKFKQDGDLVIYLVSSVSPAKENSKKAEDQDSEASDKSFEYIQDEYFVEFVLAGVVKNAKIELSGEFFPENSKN